MHSVIVPRIADRERDQARRANNREEDGESTQDLLRRAIIVRQASLVP